MLALLSPNEEGSAAAEALPEDIVYASATTVLLYLAIGVAAAFVLGLLVTAVLRRIGRRSSVVRDVEARGRRPFRIVLVLVAARVVLESATLQSSWADPVAYVVNLAIIAMLAWLAAVVAFVLEDVALDKYRLDGPDNRRARRVRTQVSLLRRLTVAVVVVLAVGAMLLTIPAAREWGATIFASAGVVGVVAGLAAQTSLANLFAGLQITFTDAIRVDDVVVIEGEFGRIEEITLTYVVLHIWDDRRLVLPSTYFTTTPIENWTRKDSEVMGAVMLDVDWEVPIDGLREEMHCYLESTPNWDGRVANLVVVEAVGGVVTLRAVVSAKDGATLWDLRTGLREALVVWLQRSAPDALPRTRITTAAEAGAAPRARTGAPAPRDGARAERAPVQDADPEQDTPARRYETGLFTGSLEAVARAQRFSGPSEEEMEERRRAGEARSGEVEVVEAPAEQEPPSWRDQLASGRDDSRG
ncbi:mechanosensitive ion channel family protein [uncultured Pseudokineococcus sp.]|uniref:mechanosensitive ion channel family protein n=1 Tax=uncultured Pseudokineococcus sp. TaxID=1642928 RepID=UPI002604C34D|nr:mechanosensitive ion channel domain-containing protein [uncultured Pseudokineococcus sp.]